MTHNHQADWKEMMHNKYQEMHEVLFIISKDLISKSLDLFSFINMILLKMIIIRRIYRNLNRSSSKPILKNMNFHRMADSGFIQPVGLSLRLDSGGL